MKVELLVRPYQQMIGLARYSESLCQAMRSMHIAHAISTPSYPFAVQLAHRAVERFGLDVHSFFATYPLAARFSRDSLKHLTVQQMAVLLLLHPRLRPAIVTVHDIVPFLVRHDIDQNALRHPVETYFERMAMRALKRADMLISVSHFTKKTLVEALGLPEARIAVVHEGVEHEKFRPRPVSDDFRAQYGLDRESRYVLYVGSENPRKNLPRLLAAFAKVQAAVPQVKLLKVGSPQHPAQVEQLRRQIDQLGLSQSVLIFDDVSDDDLVLFYNVADLFVFPSLYEGFGLPPLEAMASGTPVVSSSATSLPEVVGDAAIIVDPYDVDGLARSMTQVLADSSLRESLRARGLERAQHFTWERSAKETIAVYEQVWDSFKASVVIRPYA